MPMLLLVLAFLLGFAVLWAAAGWFVRGVSGLAARIGARPATIGFMAAAFGICLPELCVCVAAVIGHLPGAAIGVTVGANIANIGLIAGVAALIAPLAAGRSLLKVNMVFLFASMALLYVVGFDSSISRFDGAFMFLVLLAFVAVTLISAKKREEKNDNEDAKSTGLAKALIYVAAGIAGLALGGKLLAWSAGAASMIEGISDMTVAATIVALGISLPKLAVVIVSIIRKQPEIGIGGLIGANVFNICAVFGILPFLKPLPLPRYLLKTEFPLMICFSAALALMLLKRKSRVTRIEGLVLFAAYVAFLAWYFNI